MKKRNHIYLTSLVLGILFLGMSSQYALGQSMSVNSTGTAPDGSAMLDIASSTKGFLVPRMTNAQRGAIPSPATGLLIFQTDGSAGFYYNAGTPGSPNWSQVGKAGWELTGNSGTTVGTNFIGTTDAVDVAIYTNNAERVRVEQGGDVGIGITNPTQKLHVVGNSLVTGNTYIGNTDSYFYRDAANRIATPDQFYVQSSSANTYLYSANTYLGATSGDAIHLRGNYFDWTGGTGGIINTSGDVGIGTASPSQKLHVAGSVLIDEGGSMYVGASGRFYSDATYMRYVGPRHFYITSAVPNTYLYSTNTYLGASSGDNIHLRGNLFDWTSGGGGIINTSGNMGIGTTSPGAKLEVTGQIKITGGTPGANKVLVSDAVGLSSWSTTVPYGNNIKVATSTTDISIASSTYADMTGMSVSITPVHSTVYVTFTAAGNYTGTFSSAHFAHFRVLKDGVAVKGTSAGIGEFDDLDGGHNTWSCSFTYPVSVTVGVATTIKVQWAYFRYFVDQTLWIRPSVEPIIHHRTLSVLD